MTEEDRQYLRRARDEYFSTQLQKNSDRLQNIELRLTSLEERLEDREKAVITQAVYQAQKSLLARFGVDVDKPESVDAFSKSLQFGKSMQGTMTKAAWAFLSAFCGGMGMALWVIIGAALGRSQP
jgi:predicted ribosome quality control (RQC) complex YloA/Tae2 family protein